jgi:acetyltransferase-like isoleucine patch superfamily enzyme
MDNQFYSSSELKNLGIRYGKNCKVHKKINITNPQNLILGNDVRVDAYCNIVNPKIIKIHSKVHISPYVYLVANGGSIKIKSFTGLSAGVQIYTATDDYTGGSFFGPFNKDKFLVKKNNIIINEYSIIGCNSIILPGATIPKGVSIGALSLVNKKLKPWSIYSGNPLKYILPRKKKIISSI